MRQPDEKKDEGMRTSTHDTLTHPCHRQRWCQEGRVTLSQLICLAVLVVVGTQGLKFIGPWYDHLRLRGAMQEAVKQAPFSTDAAVSNAVLAKAKDLQLPLDPRHLHVERGMDGGTRLRATYAVTLTFPLGFSHTQHFRPEVRSSR